MPFDIITATAIWLLCLACVLVYALWVDPTMQKPVLSARNLALLGLVTFLAAPAPISIATALGKESLMGYHEFWNGLEKSAIVEETRCTRDGSCRHTYSCDSYVIMVPRTTTISDGKGGTTTKTTMEPETHWHSCPYVDAEYTFKVTDTMGSTYVMGDHWFPENPNAHRWEGRRERLPRVSAGIPVPWAQAQARIDAGTPGGTTARKTYKNYVLASQVDIFEQHSDKIEAYRDKGLLPKVTTTVHDQYHADKVYVMGSLRDDLDETTYRTWQDELMRFNGHLGSVKQGDLHVVLVNDTDVPDGTQSEYSQALQAWFSSTRDLGKDTLSKNGVVVIVGVRPAEGPGKKQTIAWSDAFTGMPLGNEQLPGAARSMRNTEIDLGSPASFFANNAALHHILMGEDGYQRVEMKTYKYLESHLKPPFGYAVAAGVISIVATITMCFGSSYLDPDSVRRSKTSFPATVRHH